MESNNVMYTRSYGPDNETIQRKTQPCSKTTEFLSGAARAQRYLTKVFSLYGSSDEKCILAQLIL